MADCNEVDAALNRLGNKIDGLNKKISALEKEQAKCCNNKNSNVDLKDIYRRLTDLELVVKKIADYINATDEAIKLANKALQFIVNLFVF
jgi:hypothetical protein